MKPGEDLIRALVEDAKDAYDPREKDYARVLGKLRAATGRSAGPARSPLRRWGPGLLATGAVIFGALSVTRATTGGPPPAPASAQEDRPTVIEAPPEGPSALAIPTLSVDALPSIPRAGEPPRPARPVPAPSASTSATPGSSLAEEIRLLRAANEASRAADHARALSLVEEHEARFPRGFLADERRVQKVLALCGLDRGDQARAEARRFVADHPTSPLNARLSSSCAGEESSPK